MKTLPYLIFRLNGSLFGLRAEAVREVERVPELTPVEESPRYIAGQFNLRGRIVPVMDLDARFGRPGGGYGVSDHVLVIEGRGVTAGVIANEACRVEGIPKESIENPPQFPRPGAASHHLLEGEAKSGDEIIMLISIDALLGADERDGGSGPAPLERRSFFREDLSPEDRETLRERARRLRLEPPAREGSSLLPLAVIALNGELFAIGLDHVNGFSGIKNLAPVPCCPPHIMGNMNIGGNLLTLLDVRGLFGLQPRPFTPGSRAKAVIVSREGATAAIAADEVLEVIYLDRSSIGAAPAVLSKKGGEYVIGAARYGERMMTVVDLERVLESDDLVVNDGA